MQVSDYIKTHNGLYKPGDIAVLTVLADEANHMGLLFLGAEVVTHIAAMTGISSGHIKKIISKFKRWGVLVTQTAAMPNALELYRLVLIEEVPDDE